MNEDLEKKIQRARELLATTRHASMATVNEDGSPHNSPFRFLYDPKLRYVYWGSHPSSLHSMNIARTGQIFVVMYDRTEKGSGLYIRAENGHALSGAELDEALAVLNNARIKEGSQPLELGYYTGESPQRMWRAEIKNLWVNYTDKDQNGNIRKDARQEIRSEDLLG